MVECVDLAKKNGNCDPFVVATAIYTNKKKVIKRTKVQRRTINPVFGDTLYFDLTVDYDSKSISGNNVYTVAPLDGADLYEVNVAVWHDLGMGGDISGRN